MTEKAKTINEKEYKKTGTYKVGERIYHPVFQDSGKIIKKLPGTNQQELIVAKFDKSGTKKLLARKTKKPAQLGNKVSIEVKATCHDDTPIRSLQKYFPNKFTIGKEKIFPVLQESIIGMKEDETRTITITPEQAFGPYNKDQVFKIRIPDLEGKQLKIGKTYKIRNVDNQVFSARLVDFDKNTATMDANHLLAGKTITLHIKLLQIIDR